MEISISLDRLFDTIADAGEDPCYYRKTSLTKTGFSQAWQVYMIGPELYWLPATDHMGFPKLNSAFLMTSVTASIKAIHDTVILLEKTSFILIHKKKV